MKSNPLLAVFRKSSLFVTGIVFVLGLSMNSCAFDKADPVPPPPPGNPCDSITPSFANDIQPIFTQYCSDANFGSCHESGSGIRDFTQYGPVKEVIDDGRIENRIITVGDMPPTFSQGPTAMAPDDVQIIQCWIEQGAPNN